MSSSRRSQQDSRISTQQSRWLLAVALISFLSGSCQAFSMTMTYKPPLKSISNVRNSNRQQQSRTSTSKSAYAGALAPPASMSSPVSFEQRMRKMVLGANKPKQAVKQASPPNVMTVTSLSDFRDVVANEKEKIVAVRFHATWCKACKAMAPLFYKLARENGENIVFVDVPVTPENANLHQGLGVPSLPFGHIYHPNGGLVEELRMTKKQMPEFEQTLQCYIDGQCDLDSRPQSNE